MSDKLCDVIVDPATNTTAGQMLHDFRVYYDILHVLETTIIEDFFNVWSLYLIRPDTMKDFSFGQWFNEIEGSTKNGPT